MDYTLLSMLFSVFIMLSGCNNNLSAADKVIDTTGVTRVQISGDASMIRLTTKEAQISHDCKTYGLALQ